jgi:hypothetical protein
VAVVEAAGASAEEAVVVVPPPPVDECAELWERIGREGADAAAAGLPGADHGHPLLLHAKGTPLWFRSAPQRSAEEQAVLDGDEALARDAEAFWSAGEDADAKLRRLLDRHGDHPEELRAALLRSGILYAENAGQARALVLRLKLGDLLEGDPAWLRRGDQVLELDRRPWGYRFREPLCGRDQRATIILFDRIGETRESVAEPFATDLGAVKDRYGLERFRLTASFEGKLAAVLRFVDDPVERRAVFSDGGTALALECLAGGQEAEAARERAAAVQEWRSRLRRTVETQVAENLFFDEPEVEIGQQDGKLREQWSLAYFSRLETYEFNGVSYDVFDGDGTPLVPQVCIDFCLDTYERASGRWFLPRGEPPGRTEGFIVWNRLDGFARRTVPKVVEWARTNPEVFDLYEVPEEDRVGFEDQAGWEEAMLRLAPQLAEGDILVIFGLREEDMNYHYHTVVVHRQDPLSGLPAEVGVNAGHARVVTLRDAMENAPRRSIRFRLRVRWDWIRERMAQAEAAAAAPEVVVAEPVP